MARLISYTHLIDKTTNFHFSNNLFKTRVPEPVDATSKNEGLIRAYNQPHSVYIDIRVWREEFDILTICLEVRFFCFAVP